MLLQLVAPTHLFIPTVIRKKYSYHLPVARGLNIDAAVRVFFNFY